MPVARLALPQTTETPAAARSGPRFGFRAAYARSADSQAHGDTGQDYVALRVDEERLAFALCDGVSQSFMGEMASQAVGEALADWFWQALPDTAEGSLIRAALADFLTQLAPSVTDRARAFPLAPDLSPVIRDVMEQKRELGTESTFIAGCADTATGRLTLAWMGDSRLRLWGAEGEVTDALLGADKFITAERWSSRRGLVGELHVAVLPLRRIKRLLAYSDGLTPYDGKLKQHLSDAELNRFITATKALPTSDDVSVVEVWLGQRPTPVKPPPDPATSATMVSLPPVKPPPPPTIVSTSALSETLKPTSPTPLRPVERPARKLSPWLWVLGGTLLFCGVAGLASLVLGGDWLLGMLGQRTATPTASPTLEFTVSPAPSDTATLINTATAIPSATLELTGTPTETETPTLTPTDTETPTLTLETTVTLTPTLTLTETATLTATLTLTVTTP